MTSARDRAITQPPAATHVQAAPNSHHLLGWIPQDRLRAFLRIALSSYVANGMVTAVGMLMVSGLAFLLLDPRAAAAAAVGVIVATPPDQPSPRRGKFTQFLPALLLGPPLFFVTSLVRESNAALALWLVAATFVAFLGSAWGKRGVPASVSVTFSMLFALAMPQAEGTGQAWHAALLFGLGAWAYALWSTLANALLNARYRRLAVVEALGAVTALMRTQGMCFTMGSEAQRRTALAGRLMKQQAALADQLQACRDLLLESPTTQSRLQLAGMLMQLLDMRDHLLACALNLDALRGVPAQQELLQVLGLEIQALAGDVEQLADALLRGRLPEPFVHRRPALAASAAMAPASPAGCDPQAPPLQVLAGALARRVGYLHDEVARMVALARGEQAPDVEVVRGAWQVFVSPTQWTWRPFRSLWSRDAPPLRHAVRASLAIAAGYAVGLALPWGSHDYWILLTITVVLRGSLAQTLERRNGRVAGTLLGGLLAGLMLYAHVPPLLLLLIVAAAQGTAHAFALQRYRVAAFAATVLALVLAHLLNGGSSPAFEVAERVMDTLIGVAIAWMFSYVLPSWERTRIGALGRRALAAQARHASLALGLGSTVAGDPKPELAWRLARREAYDSLSALVQAVQRALSEPRGVQPPLDKLERMLGLSYQLLAQLTAIKTMLLQRRERLDVQLLQQPFDQAARAITAALAGSAAQPPVPAGHDAALALPALPADSEHDLTALLLRRLRQAVASAQDLKADATLALGESR